MLVPVLADAEPFRLEEWLTEIGVTPSKVSVTAKQLRDNDLDDRSLLQKITADELKECGVASVGIRKCIIEAVRSPQVDESLLAGFKCTFDGAFVVSGGVTVVTGGAS